MKYPYEKSILTNRTAQKKELKNKQKTQQNNLSPAVTDFIPKVVF